MKNITAHSKQSQLIAIDHSTVNGEEVQTVNARDLHSYLESKQEFANWIKDRVSQYGFIEGSDFLIILSKTPNGGRPSKEYHITIEMAKELSMVERNDKGKEMRQYFIECERQAKSKELPNKNQFKSYLPEYRQARAMELATRALDKMFANLPNLGEQSKQVIYADTINPIAGKNIIPLPVLENRTYTATEIGEQLGISANKVGRLAKELNLKRDEYGIFVLDKSKSSDKQVETFRYYQKAIDALSLHLANGVAV